MRGIVVLGVLTVLVTTAMGRDVLFDAIVEVESQGNPHAVGDGGRAHGLTQAWRVAWKDGCKALGVDWNYATGVRDPRKCSRIFYAYTSMYGAQTDQERARTWNGGPSGIHRACTLSYWRKVRRAMRRMDE
jgi:hypothetical protein